MTERKLQEGIIAGINKFYAGTESPEQFRVWSAISTISAALGKNVVLDRGHYRLFPNMYIVLVAGSAKCRKSTSIEISKELLTLVEPRVHILAQRMTPEALAKSLSSHQAVSETPTGLVVEGESTGMFIVDELSTLIDKKSFDSGMIALLTKLYDGRDYEYETISRGKECLVSPCLGIFGGSTLQWIKEAVPITAIGGGWTSRVVFVYCKKLDELVPHPVRTEAKLELRNLLANDLIHIRRLRGQMNLTDEAEEAFDVIYRDWFNTSEMWESMTLSGYAGRRHDILLKVAMVLSASVSDSLLITAKHIRAAEGLLIVAEAKMPQVLAAICSEEHAQVEDEIGAVLRKYKTVTRQYLLRRLGHRLTAQMLDMIMTNVEARGMITIHAQGSQVIYTLSEDVLGDY